MAKSAAKKSTKKSAKPTASIRMNQIVTDVPFGEGTINSYLDTSSGAVEMELGSLENPDLTVTTDYATAKAVFVDQDQQAGDPGPAVVLGRNPGNGGGHNDRNHDGKQGHGQQGRSNTHGPQTEPMRLGKS